MKRFYRDLSLTIIVAIFAFGACWMLGHSFIGYQEDSIDPHQWLHEQLDLTVEQDEQLIPIEKKFTSKKHALEELIYEADFELALAIKEDGHYSMRVKEAVDKIHIAQGELQKATLEHLFELHSVLTPEQQNKLNDLTTQTLTHHP